MNVKKLINDLFNNKNYLRKSPTLHFSVARHLYVDFIISLHNHSERINVCNYNK